MGHFLKNIFKSEIILSFLEMMIMVVKVISEFESFSRLEIFRNAR